MLLYHKNTWLNADHIVIDEPTSYFARHKKIMPWQRLANWHLNLPN